MATFWLEQGLSIELVAAEPLVVEDPVAFAFDEWRRLYSGWVLDRWTRAAVLSGIGARVGEFFEILRGVYRDFRMRIFRCVIGALNLLAAGFLRTPAVAGELPGDRMLSEYFHQETSHVNQQTFANVKTLADWTREREKYLEQLRKMLGLSPVPVTFRLLIAVACRPSVI